MKTIFLLLLCASTAFGQLESRSRRVFGTPGLTRSGGVSTATTLPFTDTFDSALASAWTGATWTVSGGRALNTPTTTGSELIQNPFFETDTSGWTPTNSGTLTRANDNGPSTAGSHCMKIARSTTNYPSAIDTVVSTLGGWYRAEIDLKGANKSIKLNFLGGSSALQYGTWGKHTATGRRTGATVIANIQSNGTAGTDSSYFDNASVYALSLPTLFATIKTVYSDVSIDVDSMVIGTSAGAACSQAGIVMNLDSVANPKYFVIAYHDGTNAKLDKCVNGTYTSVITAATTYGEGNTLHIEKVGTTYSLYYGGVQVGTSQTISDAGIRYNKRHGIFSTTSSNTLAKVTIAVNTNPDPLSINIGYSGSSVSSSQDVRYYPTLVQTWFTGYYPTYVLSKSQTATGGCGTWNSLARFATEIATASPRILIHDTAWQGVDSISKGSMEAFIRKAARIAAMPIVVFSATVSDINADSTIDSYINEAANDTIRSICTYYGVSVVDWPARIKAYKDAGGHINSYFADNVHHTALGDTVLSRMVDTVLIAGWATLPDTTKAYLYANTLKLMATPTVLRGTQFTDTTGTWTISGDTISTTQAGATITFTGTFSSFGTDRVGTGSDFYYSIDGGEFGNSWSVATSQNGYYIGTYIPHTVILKANSGTCALSKFLTI
jgi:hypothetical protein